MKKLAYILAVIAMTITPAPAQMRCWIVGDLNNDGDINLTDLVSLSNFLFGGGPAPERARQADFDDNGQIDTTDLVLLSMHLFQGCDSCLGPLDTICEFHVP